MNTKLAAVAVDMKVVEDGIVVSLSGTASNGVRLVLHQQQSAGPRPVMPIPMTVPTPTPKLMLRIQVLDPRMGSKPTSIPRPRIQVLDQRMGSKPTSIPRVINPSALNYYN